MFIRYKSYTGWTKGKNVDVTWWSSAWCFLIFGESFVMTRWLVVEKFFPFPNRSLGSFKWNMSQSYLLFIFLEKTSPATTQLFTTPSSCKSFYLGHWTSCGNICCYWCHYVELLSLCHWDHSFQSKDGSVPVSANCTFYTRLWRRDDRWRVYWRGSHRKVRWLPLTFWLNKEQD